jgi:hypothetical protein
MRIFAAVPIFPLALVTNTKAKTVSTIFEKVASKILPKLLINQLPKFLYNSQFG